MMLQVKVIWHLLNLCAIAFAWNVQGSSGFSVFASKDAFSSFTSVEEQNHGYMPSAAPFLNGSFVQPPGPVNIHPTVSTNQSAVTPSSTIPFHALHSAASPKPTVSILVPDPAAGTLPLPPVNPPSTTYHGSSPAIPPSTTSLSPPSVAAMAPKQDQTPEDLPSPSPLLQVMPSAVPSHDSGFSPTSSHDVFTPPRNLVPSQSLAPQPPPAIPPITTTSPVSAQSPPSAIPPITTPSPVSALPPPSARLPITIASPVSAQPPRFAIPPITTPSPVSAPPPKSTLSNHHPPHKYPLPLPAHVDLSPSPEAPSYDLAPSHNATITEHSSPPISHIPPLHAMPPISLIPPPDAAPVRDVAPSSPAESHFSAPPPRSATPSIATPSPVSATSSPVSAPPPHSATPPITTSSPVSAPPPHSATPPITTPSPVSALPPNSTVSNHHLLPLPAPINLSPSPEAAPSHDLVPPPNSTIPEQSAPEAAPVHDVAPSSPAESHFSAPPPNATNQPPDAVPPTDSAPPSHIVSSSPPTESHFSAPPPSDTVPPTVPLPPLDAAPPSHDVVSSPPTESHFSAPPPDAIPPTVPFPPLDAAPPSSHDVVSSPPTAPHFSASPPTPSIHAPNSPPDVVPPTVSFAPPNAAPPSHDVASSPPTESHFLAPPPNPLVQAPNPPQYAVPPTVTSPPPNAAPPSHDLASSSPPTNPPDGSVSLPPPDAAHELAPSPTFVSHFSAPPTSGSVKPSHASPPSTTAEPPLTASPPVISNSSAPLAAPPVRPPSVIPVLPMEPPSIAPEAQLPHVSSPAPSIDQRGDPVPVAPSGPIYPLSPTNDHPEQGFSPSTAPSIHKSKGLPISPTAETAYSPSLSPLPSIDPTHNRRHSNHSSPETSYTAPSPSPKQQGHTSLTPAPTSHNPGSSADVAPAQSPLIEDYISPVPMSTVPVTPGHSMTPFVPPEISPSTSEPIIVLAPPMLALPPPPPNQDCLSYTCLDPYTNTIPGSPCGCVLPMRVELRIGVALYTFFPLVPEFAREIATDLFMKQSQVRVMGANAASDKPDKTLLLIDLVPLNDKFDNITALLIFERFWNHQVDISKTLFGDYQVLDVQYPGLPASPPMAPSDAINGGPYPGENGSKINPLGVDVTKQRRKHRLSGSLIAIIAFSAVGALLLFLLLGWILLFRHRRQREQSAEAANVHPSSIARSTGPTGQSAGSRPSFSLSFESSVAAYSGSAKTFSAAEIERATDNFNPSRVLGEGGFGLVYSATLEDSAEVAVKVLKREDQQGGREFLAEIEMLSRLHHRNLVKLIGICAEEHIHCLIYELIPNGSVESHLHGIDKKTSPLDWSSRLKIALGAARGLAYLHEDSSPRVIHRDFKASNILLEADFTPKVSDFGLARTAMDEDNKHISTRVMGTFGYVAPEYAMTGHLLVKSDVYSYGVVLLELLTGRKPVDMSQPSGQENLVAWTRPYLTTKEALKSIIDPNLGPYISFESVAKVAAIASMCVQPEVSHRPFMGEVVQALKLVCNECDDSREDSSGSTGSENDYRETRDMDVEKALSVSDVFCKDSGLSDSYRRGSSSGPIDGGRSWRFWKRGGKASSREDGGENGVYRFWSGSH